MTRAPRCRECCARGAHQPWCSETNQLDRALAKNIEAWRGMLVEDRLTVDEFERNVENALRNHDAGRSPSALLPDSAP